MLKIVKDNVASQHKKSELVTLPLSKEDENLLKEMVSYLKKSQDEKYCQKHHIRAGVGLAAPQIGVNKRMFAIYYTKEDEVVEYGLVNPKIIQNSMKKVALKGGEGCLSVDEDHSGFVYRYDKIVMKAYDVVSKKEVLIKAKGYDAIVLQHEYDHLDGILYYDRINKKEPNKEIPNSYLI